MAITRRICRDNRVLILATAVLLIAVVAFMMIGDADDSDASTTFTVDGINYETTAIDKAKVVSNSYFGDVIIPESVTYAGKTYSVTAIGEYAFYECRQLTSIVLPSSITSVEYGAFIGCTKIASLSLPEGITSISGQLFYQCTSLKSVTLPESLEYIGYAAFYQCTSLTSITIPYNVTHIDDNSFMYCTSLSSITISSNVSSIDDLAFYGCTLLEEINVSVDNSHYCSDDGVLFNKDKTTLIEYPIGKRGTSYSIPSSVSTIENYAFQGCRSLNSISIPSSVSKIGAYTFCECISLTSVNMSDGVISIGGSAFKCCSGLTSVNIPNSVESIGDNVFAKCMHLEEISVSDGNIKYSSVDGVLFNKDKTTLIQYPINKMDSIYSVPNGVNIIYTAAFQLCSHLESVILPNSITHINDDAFNECSSLASVNIPNGVTTIGSTVFENCPHIVSISIPDSVTSIGSYIFRGCSLLEEITVSSGNTKYSSYDGVLYNKDKTVLIKCPEGKKETSYTIYNGAETIYYDAFNNCLCLKSVTIPNTTTMIYSLFYGCTSLENITVSSGNTKYSSNNGVLFSKDGTKLYLYPAGKTDTSYTIPDTVTIIMAGAFSGCQYLDHIGVTGLNTAFVSDCGVIFNTSKTTLVVYPAGKTDTSYTIPDTVTKISDDAIKNCVFLSSVYISDKVSVIGYNAFYSCRALTEIIVSEGNMNYSSEQGVLFNKDKSLLIKYPEGKEDVSYTIPNDVVNVGAGAFGFCESLNTLTIPDSILIVGTGAFFGFTFYDFDGCTRIDNYELLGYRYVGGSLALTRNNIPNVLYDEDGGTVKIEDSYVRNGDMFILPDYGGTKIGHCFNGWSYNGESYDVGESISKENGNMTFVAIWSPIPYDVVFMNGNEVFSSKSCGYGSVILAPAGIPTKASTVQYDYTFLKWDGFTEGMTVSGDHTFYAVYSETVRGYTVTFMSQDGNSVLGMDVVEYGSDASYYGETPTKEKTAEYTYTFVGWNIEKDSEFETEDVLKNIQSDRTVYAAFSKTVNEYVVSYNVNGGSGTVASDIISGKYVLKNYEGTKGGYAFGGWTDGGHTYNIGEITIIAEDTVFTAVWLDKISVGGLNYGILSDNEVAVVRGNYSGSISIPSSITYNSKNYSVVSISDNAFYRCGPIYEVTIPNSVRYIGYAAFECCSMLSSISIPSSVMTIGDEAFVLCTSLHQFVVSEENMYFSSDNGVLFNKDHTKLMYYPVGKDCSEYLVPNGVTSIGSYAFYCCDSLTTIIIADGVLSIGENAFASTSISSVTIPDSVIFIGDYALRSCLLLEEIVVSDGNTGYCSEDGVLFNKEKTELIQYPIKKTCETYSIPDSVKIICASAFSQSELKSIIIPESVESIEESAFWTCKNLISITIPSKIKCIESYTFAYCLSLESIIIPENVISIGDASFFACLSLKSIVVPDNVVSIGIDAFYDCKSIELIHIGYSVTSIGNCAFLGCTSVSLIIIHGDIESLGSNSFSLGRSEQSVQCTVTGCSYGQLDPYGGEYTTFTYVLVIDLDSNGGSESGYANVSYGGYISDIVDATRSEFTIEGYYTLSSGGVKVIDKSGNLIAGVNEYTDSEGKWIRTSGGMLYAHWNVTVTLSNEGGDVSFTYSINDGSFEQYCGEFTIPENSKITVNASADTGYSFVKWSDDVPTSSRTAENVSSNISWTAIAKYVDATVNVNGAVEESGVWSTEYNSNGITISVDHPLIDDDTVIKWYKDTEECGVGKSITLRYSCSETEYHAVIEFSGSYGNLICGSRVVKIDPISNPIVITAGSASKEYDSKALSNSEFTYTSNIIISGDTLIATVSGTITDVGSEANKIVSYSVTHGDTDVTNCYTFGETIDGLLEITAASVSSESVRWSSSQSYTYTSKDQGNTISAEFDGVGSDGTIVLDISFIGISGAALGTTAFLKAGSYTATAVNTNTNYQLSTTEKNFTISKLTTDVCSSGNVAPNKEYDGNTTWAQSGDYYSFSSVYECDLEDIVLSGVFNYNDKNVPGANKVLASDLTISGTSADNYTLSNTSFEIADATISPKQLKIDCNSTTKVYDGNKVYSDYTITNLVGDDDVLLSASFNSKDVATANKISFAIIGGAQADNYTAPGEITEGVSITVLKLILGETGTKTKAYDGNTSYTGYALGNVVDGETVTVTASFNASNVSDADTIEFTLVDGEYSSNYSAPESISGSITKAKMKDISQKNVDYDGSSSFATIGFMTGVNNEIVNLEYTSSSPNVDTYIYKSESKGFTLSYSGEQNYDFGTVGNLTIERIDQSPLFDGCVFTYGTTRSVSVMDLMENPSVIYSLENETFAKINQLNGKLTWVSEGSVQATAVYSETTNYNGGSISCTVTTEKATVVITSLPEAVSGLTYNGSYQNLITAGMTTGGVMMYSLTSGSGYDSMLSQGKNAGDYKVYYKVAGGRYYKDIDEAGPISVSIGKKALSGDMLSIISDHVYDGTEKNVEVSVRDGNALSDKDWSFDSTSITSSIDSGTYAITVVASDSGNYTGSIADSWSIAKKQLSKEMIIVESSFIYDGELKTVKYAVKDGTALKTNDWAEAEGTQKSGINAGTYTIRIDAEPDGNYVGSASKDWYILVEEKEVKEGDRTVAELSFDEGIRTDAKVNVKGSSEASSETKALIKGENKEVLYSYDVSITVDGKETQPDGKVTVRLIVPEDLKDVKFELYHVHNGNSEKVSYAIDGEYVVFTVDSFSEFVFAKNPDSNSVSSVGTFLIILGIIGVLAVIVVFILVKKFGGKKNDLENGGEEDGK